MHHLNIVLLSVLLMALMGCNSKDNCDIDCPRQKVTADQEVSSHGDSTAVSSHGDSTAVLGQGKVGLMQLGKSS